jgi:phosphate uptake regulator
MQRKVIRQGHSTLTITLPKKWAEHNRITPGTALSIDERDDRLQISVVPAADVRTITLNSAELERFSLAKLLSACYELDLDKITIRLGKERLKCWQKGETDFHQTLNFYVDRLIGFEVTTQSKSHIDIENLSKTLLKLDSTVARLFSMLIENLDHFIEAVEKRDITLLADGELRHDAITKFASLGLRIVYEDHSLTDAERFNSFVFLTMVDKAADFMRYAYRHMPAPRDTADMLKLVRLCRSYVETYRSFHYHYDHMLVNKLDDIRGSVKKHARSMKDAEVAGYWNAFVEVLSGCVKPRIMIEMDRLAR